MTTSTLARRPELLIKIYCFGADDNLFVFAPFEILNLHVRAWLEWSDTAGHLSGEPEPRNDIHLTLSMFQVEKDGSLGPRIVEGKPLTKVETASAPGVYGIHFKLEYNPGMYLLKVHGKLHLTEPRALTIEAMAEEGLVIVPQDDTYLGLRSELMNETAERRRKLKLPNLLID